MFKNFIVFNLVFLNFVFADTTLIVLGSGTPNPDPERSGSAYAVIVDNKSYLVDFGTDHECISI